MMSRLLAAAIALANLCAGATITGKVTKVGGEGVANAKVSAKSTTGALSEAVTDASGAYTLANLAPGEYTLTVTVTGQPPKTQQVTLTEKDQTVDIRIGEALGLGDLGFTPAQTKGSAEEQARLNRRSHMLKTHQRLGLITTVPLIATLISSGGAGGHNSSAHGRELHAALGSITAGMYLTTASFSIFAPRRPAGESIRGGIRWHRRLAWIHGPGMILTPILGAIAYKQRERGEKVHGIASIHAPVAVITTAAFGAAIASVMIRF